MKLIHIFPSQTPFPLFTIPGMLAVCNSSNRCKIPCLLRKPTMIFGTPSKNDCIQNFNSLRSYLSWSRSFSMEADVLSSTQLMGVDAVGGLVSHTAHVQ